ncbi:AAA family ATPase [Acidobacteriia bacterium AH_259_A11_L15]|nr:AAA family ATPase [Acidobacteriia bacterium AH_259_A11_L15]
MSETRREDKASRLPTGALTAERILPDPVLDAHWERIIIPEDLRQGLLGQAVVSMTIRRRLGTVASALHGIILLTGAPGTGKTTLARGLANRVARANQREYGKMVYAEVDPHRLPSELLGRTQQAVTRLLGEEIPAFASNGKPAIILLDEVESLATSRTKASMETNPVDVHRATDAVLAGVDRLAEEFPHLLFLATTNFSEAVDYAFISRVDAVFELPLPSLEAGAVIIEDTLKMYANEWKSIEMLATKDVGLAVAEVAQGLDGRQLRKLVAHALAMNLDTASDPGKLTRECLLEAAKRVVELSRQGGQRN